MYINLNEPVEKNLADAIKAYRELKEKYDNTLLEVADYRIKEANKALRAKQAEILRADAYAAAHYHP